MQAAWPCSLALLVCGCGGDHGTRPPRVSTNPCDALTELHRTLPVYPREAALDEQQGWVELRYHVGVRGDVFNVRIVASEPEGVFDEASTMALVRRQYAPMTYPVRNCAHADYYVLRDRGRTAIVQSR